MNRRDYQLHLDGRQAAGGGAGLSDSPYGGRDGDLWRSGVRSWLDETGDLDAAGPDLAQNPTQDGPGQAISTPRLSGHPHKTERP